MVLIVTKQAKCIRKGERNDRSLFLLKDSEERKNKTKKKNHEFKVKETQKWTLK